MLSAGSGWNPGPTMSFCPIVPKQDALLFHLGAGHLTQAPWVLYAREVLYLSLWDKILL